MRRLLTWAIIDRDGLRAAVRGLGVLIVTVAGIWLGVGLGAQATTPVGPFQATLSVTPTLYGDSEVDIPPLGSLMFDTHDGPAHLAVRMDSLDRGRTEQLITDRSGISRA